MKAKLIFASLFLSMAGLSAQTYQVPVSEQDEPMMKGKFEPTWSSLENYQVPEWFRNVKFGIWAHWGPQCVEGSGDWMARSMYMEGTREYEYHVKHYGHPSEVGFKDIILLWKAENWDPDKLGAFYKKIGAQYFFALGNHHDNMDLWDSKYQPWNSVNMGPKKDILAGWEKAARKYGLYFGVSLHADHAWSWYEPSQRHDTKGPKKGIPYDGKLTKADGKGKWWEGYDPAQLYGLPPEQRTQEYERKIKENYLLRQQELVTKYKVDLLWVDGYGFPYGDYGKEVFRTLFNNSLKQYGRINAVGIAKVDKEPMLVRDIEAGVADTILPYPWDGIFTFTHWFYKEDDPLMHNARTVIELLSDIVSKNGNMLLNVELKADGTIAPEHKKILDEVGQWVRINSKAIYGSRPWTVYGDNLNSCLRNVERHIVNADAGRSPEGELQCPDGE